MGAFTIRYNSRQHKISLVHFLPTKKIIASLDTNTQLLIVNGSYTVLHGSPKNVQLLVNVLRRRGIPLIRITNANTGDTVYEIIDNTYATGNTIYIRSKKHVFAATITEAPYHYFLKVGGDTFTKCVEIFVNKDGENTLAQIHAEPECGVDTPLLDGESVDMTKAALQLAGLLLGARAFEFIDNSEIECGVGRPNSPPPRHRTKPFSLAHLYFMTKGRTWYDYHFGAHPKSEEHRKKYNEGSATLRQRPNITFSELAPRMRLDGPELGELEPYFDMARSWISFFNAVPKVRRCDLLSWAPAFVDRLIDFEICRWPWIIDLQKMVKTDLFIMPFSAPRQQNGGVTRRQRRRRHRKTQKKILYLGHISSRRCGMQIM
jgi:hypothetical protein